MEDHCCVDVRGGEALQITAAQERYLRAIYELTLAERETRISEIAMRAGVSKASASLAVERLARDGLVTRRQRRRVELTADGRHMAVLAYGKRNIIQRFLAEVLAVPEAAAAQDAEALEPIISVETLCALCKRTWQERGGCSACERCTQTDAAP